MENKLPDFLIIPSVLITDKELRPTDLLVYGVIYWYSRLKLEKCILSNKSFSELLNVSERAIQYGLQRMDKKNYIRVVYEDSTKKVRKEIIPLVMFSSTGAKLIDGTNNRSSTHRQLFTPPSTNVHQNKNNLIRRFNNTVSNGDKNIQKLPNLSIPQEQKEYIKDEILTVLKDKQSEKFYLLVASKIPEGEIRKALSEIKVDGAENPARVFTYRMKKFAMLHQTL